MNFAKNKCSELEEKCYCCSTNIKKVDAVNDLIIKCGDDKFKFVHLYNQFNDNFLVKYLPLYVDAVNRGSKEYCIKWVEDINKYIGELE